MKTTGFWVLMFLLLVFFTYVTLFTNPQRSRYQHEPTGTGSSLSEDTKPEGKTWKNVYAELYGPTGLEKTWEVKTPKGYFDQADRDQFLKEIPEKKQFGESRVTVKEDGGDLVFGIYYKGAKP